MKNFTLNNQKVNLKAGNDLFTEVGLVLVFILIIVFSVAVLI